MQLPQLTGYVQFFHIADAKNLLNSNDCTVMLITAIFLYILWVIIVKYFRDKSIAEKATKYAFDGLHKATFENDVITTFRIIRKYPATINWPHPIDGYTPFMRSCLNGNTQLVRLMLNFGADVELKSLKGETPFYLTVFYHVQHPENRDASCIRTLYYAGADVNAPNSKGYAPLHVAAMFGHLHLVQWLLNKGASVALNPDPFILARLEGHYQTAKLLEQKRLLAIE